MSVPFADDFIQQMFCEFGAVENVFFLCFNTLSPRQNDRYFTYNAFVPNRRQAIIWTKSGQIYWRIFACVDLAELMTIF